MNRHPVRVLQNLDDHPRTDGARPLFAVLAGALVALATTAAAEPSPVADAPSLHGVDPHVTAEVAVVAGGTELVGFGTVANGRLDLQLRGDARGFVTLVVIVSAEAGAIVDAFVTADGRVTVLADTSFEPLDLFLRPFGVEAVDRALATTLDAMALASWASHLSGVVSVSNDSTDAATEAARAADGGPHRPLAVPRAGVRGSGTAHADTVAASLPAIALELGAGLSLGGAP